MSSRQQEIAEVARMVKAIPVAGPRSLSPEQTYALARAGTLSG